MVHYYQKTAREKDLRSLDQFQVGSWIYVEDPKENELKNLAGRLGLDFGLLRDALDINEAPRMERDNGNFYVFTRVPYKDEGEKATTIPVLIVTGEAFVMTISKKPLVFMERFLKGEIDFTTTQKTKLILQIFTEMDSAYGKFLTDIGRNVRGISVQLERINNRNIIQFVTFEGVLNDFISALIPTNTILNNLISGKHMQLFPEDLDLMEDLRLSNNQLIESCKNNLRTIVNIREAYSTIMTNNLNRIIRILTALTILLAVPTMIASFFGMNVMIPYADSQHAFLWIIGITAGVSGIILGIFIKNRWL